MKDTSYRKITSGDQRFHGRILCRCFVWSIHHDHWPPTIRGCKWLVDRDCLDRLLSFVVSAKM